MRGGRLETEHCGYAAEYAVSKLGISTSPYNELRDCSSMVEHRGLGIHECRRPSGGRRFESFLSTPIRRPKGRTKTRRRNTPTLYTTDLARRVIRYSGTDGVNDQPAPKRRVEIVTGFAPVNFDQPAHAEPPNFPCCALHPAPAGFFLEIGNESERKDFSASYARSGDYVLPDETS